MSRTTGRTITTSLNNKKIPTEYHFSGPPQIEKRKVGHNYGEASIDKVLADIDGLYEDRYKKGSSEYLSSVFFLNETCFKNEMLYDLLSSEHQSRLKAVLKENFVFFNLFVNNEDSIQISNILYELVYKEDDLLVKHYIDIVGTSLERKQLLSELKSLYFGSKVFNKLLDLEGVNIYNYAARLFVLYYKLIISEVVGEAGDFLLQMIKLNKFIIIEQFFIPSADNDKAFLSSKASFNEIFIQKIYKPANTVTKKKIAFELCKFLSKLTTKENYSSIYCILESLNTAYLDIDRVLTFCKNEIFIFSYLKACSLSQTKRILNVLIMKWANSASDTKLSFDTDDLLLTKLILICCKRVEEEDQAISLESQYAHNSNFLNGISKRLMNPLPMVVERTMIVAKRITSNKIDFETSVEIEFFDSELDEDKEFDDFLIVSKPQNEVKITSVQKLEESISDMKIFSEESLTDDVNKRIYFIRDFLKQLLSVSSNSTNQLSPVDLLNEGYKLLSLKLQTKNIKEIQFYIEELVPVLLTLNGRNEDESMDSIEFFRIKCLVCLIKACPSKTLNILLENLFYKELSIQPRLSILTSIGIGCVEIRNEKFAQSDIMAETSNTNALLVHDNLIKQTQITWRSRKLDFTKQESSKTTRLLRQDNIMAIIKTCYSLVAGWLRGIDLGVTYDKIFKEHYIKCLSLLYGLISDQKHLDPNRDLESGVKEVLVDAFKQNLVLDKDTLKDTNLM